jgi:hypothetical protein
MPQPFTNPGCTAISALFEFLADRTAQAMLDNITQTTATRQDEVARHQP